jgi:hypothetical protein
MVGDHELILGETKTHFGVRVFELRQWRWRAFARRRTQSFWWRGNMCEKVRSDQMKQPGNSRISLLTVELLVQACATFKKQVHMLAHHFRRNSFLKMPSQLADYLLSI